MIQKQVTTGYRQLEEQEKKKRFHNVERRGNGLVQGQPGATTARPYHHEGRHDSDNIPTRHKPSTDAAGKYVHIQRRFMSSHIKSSLLPASRYGS